MKRYIGIALMLAVAGLGFRLLLALRLPNDEPDDGRLYSRIAMNVVEHRSYSIETEEPFLPTYIRVPGYPLFIAGVYSVFGHNNNRAVRVVQAVVDTLTCLLVALLALAWSPDHWPREKRRRAALMALALAVFCPFLSIYVATILTETNTALLATACALAATLGMKSGNVGKSVAWWMIAGLLGGAATMLRSECGLFVAVVGVTLALVGLQGAFSLWRTRANRRVEDKRELGVSANGTNEFVSPSVARVLSRKLLCGVALSFGFAVALAPWTIRNARVFGVFQPIAPSQANMPGQFVPQGYIGWLRTWVDDVRYTATLEFPLDVGPIRIENVPDHAFDSPEERERVTALLDRYNNQPSTETLEPPAPAPESESQASNAEEQASNENSGAREDDSSDETESADEEESSDEPESPDETESPDDQDSSAGQATAVEMTPDIDEGFAELARERIARHPLRYYLIVPLKRASSLWFDTHSQYYRFQGELFPISSLDHDIHQQYWLPLFMFLTLLYTGLGVAGAWVMWKHADSRPWLLMVALLMLPRIAFLSSMENPEPRYVVVLFAFVSAAGGVALAAAWDWLAKVWIRGR